MEHISLHPFDRTIASHSGARTATNAQETANQLSTLSLTPALDHIHDTANHQADLYASKIADILYAHRRPVQGEGNMVVAYNPEILRRIKAFTKGNQPIRMIMSGFPHKSKVSTKTIGVVPDKAEELSLEHLGSICKEIKAKYEPGANLTVTSDGGVFEKVLDYDATTRGHYLKKLQEMIDKKGLSEHIIIKNTEGKIAENIIKDFGDSSVEVTKEKIAGDEDLERLHQQIRAFRFAEIRALHPGMSKKAASLLAKEKAYEVIRCATALSNYIDHHESAALRVSCHPKNMAGPKVGIWMDKGKSTVTPWHGVAALVHHPDTYKIIHAEKAKDLHLELVHDENQKPSHYAVPEHVDQASVTIQRFERGRQARVAARAEATRNS